MHFYTEKGQRQSFSYVYETVRLPCMLSGSFAMQPKFDLRPLKKKFPGTWLYIMDILNKFAPPDQISYASRRKFCAGA
jgi:hypothetical protein